MFCPRQRCPFLIIPQAAGISNLLITVIGVKTLLLLSSLSLSLPLSPAPGLSLDDSISHPYLVLTFKAGPAEFKQTCCMAFAWLNATVGCEGGSGWGKGQRTVPAGMGVFIKVGPTGYSGKGLGGGGGGGYAQVFPKLLLK